MEPRRAAPVVALWLRVGVGGLYEGFHEGGAAHFVEHLLFKGSCGPGENQGVRPGEIGPSMDAMGADLNAYTSHEETVVHCVLPRAHLGEALRLMGEMVFRCWFDPVEVDREREVVLDEIARSRDEPTRVLNDAISRRSWGRHPYGRSVLGSPATVRSLDASSLAAFHRRWYHPANTHLVVVGDVDLEEVRRAADAMVVGARCGRRPWVEASLPSPAAPGRDLRFVRLTGDFEEQILELAMRVPGHGHQDLPAIDMLSSALGEGASAILPQRLRVRTPLAHDAWSVTDIGAKGGLLICGASPTHDDPSEVIEELSRALVELRTDGVPVQAFQRAKAAILADRAYADETAEGRASVLSWYLGHYGSVRAEARYRGDIEALRPADVARAARLYLWPERSTLGVMGREIDIGLGHARMLLTPLGPPVRRRPRSHGARLRGVERKVVGPGVKVLVESCPEASVTSLRVTTLGGTLLESSDTAGHSRAWAELLGEGAGPLDTASFAAAVDGLSGSIGGYASLSVAGLAASFPSDRFPVALHLALLPLLAPRFDEDAVERVKRSMVDAVHTRRDSGASMAWDALFALAFPGHPYRLPAGGSERSLARLDPAALRRRHRLMVRGGNLVVAVSGAVTPGEIFSAIERLLGGLPEGQVSLPDLPREGRPRQRRRRLKGSWQQSQLQVGFRGQHGRHPDRPALDVLGVLLGSPGGRLFQRLREEAGLSYDVQAFHLSALQGGLFACALGTAPERLGEAQDALRDSLQDLVARPPSREELERAVAALVGTAEMDLQRASYRAQRMAQDECFGMDGRAYRQNMRDVERVTLDQLIGVARRYLHPDRALQVTARKSGPSRAGG